MIKFKLKTGNLVKVISGKYHGKIDNIKEINRKKNVVYLENVNRLKFIKSPKQENEKLKKVFIPIHISNVVFWEKK